MQRQAKDETDAVRVNGCLFANLALELSSEDQAVQAHLQRIFDERSSWFMPLCRRPQPTGRSPTIAPLEQSPGPSSRNWRAWSMFAKLSNDPDVLDDLWTQIQLLLGSREIESRPTCTGRVAALEVALDLGR